jgi:putative nucleotidyltransferase with HDIG domain
MGEGPVRYLPQVALATFAVAGLPAVIASAAQAGFGLPPLGSIVLAMGLSLVFARAGSALWMRRPGSRDIVFGDLMVWGWLRRMRAERRLAEAEELLGRGDELPVKERRELLKTLAAGLEARDSYTHGHSQRVARYSEAIAKGMGLPSELVAKVRTAAAVHDVGKIRTPRHILTKPGRLDDSEQRVMQEHVRDGAEMVSGLGDPEITAMVMEHHERLDGSGYPRGLPSEQIALGARIIAVADTFDAMTSARPYREAAPHKRALDVLQAESPVRLDPRVVGAFRHYYSGERAVPVSAFLTTAPQRLGSWVAGLLQGEALPVAQSLSALSAAALLGGSMIGSSAYDQGGAARQASATPALSAATLRSSPTGSDRLSVSALQGGSRPGNGSERGERRRSGSPGSRGRRRSHGGGGTAPRQQGQPVSSPAPSQLAQPSQPSNPSGPPTHVGPPGGLPVQPTITITNDSADVEVHVEPPKVLPVGPLDTGVHLNLPNLDLPKVGLPKAGPPGSG